MGFQHSTRPSPDSHSAPPSLVSFTLSGHSLELDPVTVSPRLAGVVPEPLRTHWVEVAGQRWPPKQVVEVVTGVPRREYTSHAALRVLRRLGFATSSWAQSWAVDGQVPGADHATEQQTLMTPMGNAVDLREAVEALAEFLGAQSLTTRLSGLEHELAHTDRTRIQATARAAGLDQDTLSAALQVRQVFGRISDVIHATTIVLTLEQVLEEGETLITRPSLGAGNDVGRPFDVETDRRVTEFKLAVWRGADTMRKRGVFADLVHLALDEQDKHHQLFVLGDLPGQFLETTQSTVGWGLNRAPLNLRERFAARFGTGEMTISQFRTAHAAHVEIIDLTSILPDLHRWLDPT